VPSPTTACNLIASPDVTFPPARRKWSINSQLDFASMSMISNGACQVLFTQRKMVLTYQLMTCAKSTSGMNGPITTLFSLRRTSLSAVAIHIQCNATPLSSSMMHMPCASPHYALWHILTYSPPAGCKLLCSLKSLQQAPTPPANICFTISAFFTLIGILTPIKLL
jgi:hypothetical protein